MHKSVFFDSPRPISTRIFQSTTRLADAGLLQQKWRTNLLKRSDLRSTQYRAASRQAGLETLIFWSKTCKILDITNSLKIKDNVLIMMNLLLKGLVNTLGLGLIAYLAACLALWIGQSRLIFKPSSALETTPADLGLSYDDVWLSVNTSQEKLDKIHGWWINSQKSSDKVLLYLHGNGGNISHNLGSVKTFSQQGFSVFIIDYRGYGQSEGKFPTESRVYEDAQLAWDYLVEQRQIKPKNIFIYGHSLGGAIAIDLGITKPNVAGVIVENTFTSMMEMVDYLGSFYKLFPIHLVLHQHFDSLSKLDLLQVPLLLIHGTEDRIVPSYMSEKLFQAANVPKKILLVPDATHNNVGEMAPQQYIGALQDFKDLVDRNQRELALES